MKKYVLTIILLLAALLFVSKVEATKPPRFGGVLSQGIRNIRYYISPSASRL